MTMRVSSAAPSQPHPSGPRRKRRPKGAAAPAPATAPKPKPVVTAAPAAPAPAALAAPKAPAAPEGPVASPEYDAVDITGVFGDIAGGKGGGVINDLVGEHVSEAVANLLDPEKHPFLGTPYGKVIAGKVAGTVTGEIGHAVGSIVGDTLRGVMHGKVKGVEEGKPGLGYTPTPANKLIAGTVKGITTSWMKLAVTEALKPAPVPTPVYAPDVKPIGMKPVPAPPAPTKVLLTDTAKIKGAITNGLISTAIGAFYDQAVGPIVQRAANFVTGRAGEEVKAPSPLTPGKVVNGLVDSVVGSMLVRSVEYQPLPPVPGTPPPPPGAPAPETPFAGALGVSILNNIIGAAWSTVYSRGVGTAIENGVNELAGIRNKEDVAKAKLPALEHFSRAATRGVAVGATTYVLGNALTKTMVNLGAQLGGVGGALVAVGGAALIGSIGGAAVDATVGPMLGKLGGQIYSWITGKPAYEQRAQDAAKKPGSTPGDPVKAPNGNPGTVPAPAPAAPVAPAPAAPAAGAPKKRRKSGVAAVDRTSPAIGVPNAKLAKVALQG